MVIYIWNCKFFPLSLYHKIYNMKTSIVLSSELLTVSRYEYFTSKSVVIDFIFYLLDEFPEFDNSDTEILKVYEYDRQGTVDSILYVKRFDKYFKLYYKEYESDGESYSYFGFDEITLEAIEQDGSSVTDDYVVKFKDLKDVEKN